MADNFSFTMDMGTLGVNAKILQAGFNKALEGYMKANAPKVQDYARIHAPWTDRTGNARQGLFTRYSKTPTGVHRLSLYHTVSYGIWLEVAHAGQYAIIQPTIQSEAVRIMKGIGGLIEKLDLVA